MILSPQRGLSKESQKARGFCPAVSIAGVNAASNSISTILFFLFRELHYSRPSHIYKLEDKDLLLLSTSSSSHLSPDRRVLSGGVITVTIPAHQVESRRLQTDWADSSLSLDFCHSARSIHFSSFVFSSFSLFVFLSLLAYWGYRRIHKSST